VVAGGCIYAKISQDFEDRKNKDTRNSWKLTHPKHLKGNFIVTYTTPIVDTYNINPNSILGKGSFGVVVLGMKRDTKVEYAIKIVNKSSEKSTRIQRELRLLKDVDHPNIVRLFAAYDTKDQVGFVMEMCTGGHIGLIAEGPGRVTLSEDRYRSIVGQLVSAVSHMHSRGICHRDIKLQNILLEDTRPNAQIKLIDFGLGTRFIGALPLKTRCGTLYTTAPEVFKQNYDERCDVWSCGVVCYILLSGERPFVTNKPRNRPCGKDEIIKNISTGNYSYHGYKWKHVSLNSKKFIDSLLVVDYHNRCSADDALEHPWFNQQLDGQRSTREIVLSESTNSSKFPSRQHSFDLGELQQLSVQKALANMRRNSLKSTLHRTSMVAIAYSLPQCKLEDSRAIFQCFDSDHNGSLSREEFQDAMLACSTVTSGNYELTKDDIDNIFDTIDVNKDGSISFTEFLAATLDPRDVDTETLKTVFDLMDTEQKGLC
jgi:calcium-dependent protein kinase